MPVIPLADIKAHLNITTNLDDTLIADKLAAAEAWVDAYTGGALTESSPAPLKEAARMLAAHLYENREASLVGVTADALPFGLMDMLTPYRAWAF